MMTEHVSTAKVPYPRQLTTKESLDSLTHWQSSLRNYFRRSPQFSEFFRRSSTWDCSQQNYGFDGEDAEDRADNLESLLDTISSFLPGPYITHHITKNSTNLQSIWDCIWDHYGVKPSQSSLLDYVDLQHNKSDRYIDLFDRMIYHQMNHLCPSGTNGGSHGTLKQDDTLTLSHKNLIALNWLQRIDPKLVGIVKTEYSKDLKSGTPLAALVKTIAENIDSLLSRYSQPQSMVNHLSCAETEETDQTPVMRIFNRGNFQSGPRYNFRGTRGQQGFSPNPRFTHRYQYTAPNPNYALRSPVCQSCSSLGTRLSIKVDSNHLPQHCPQLTSVRSVQTQEYPAEYELPAQEYTDCNFSDPAVDEGKVSLTETSWIHDTCTKIRIIENRFSQSNISKSKSPSAKVKLGSLETYCIIDEGSELCCIDHSFALQNNILFSRTSESAVSAGSFRMQLMGETQYNIILNPMYGKSFIRWNIGRCVVVLNLGCPILIGEPGKSANSILTDPVTKSIKTRNIHGQYVSFPYAQTHLPVPRTFLCRSPDSTVVYPNDDISIPVPSHYLQSEPVYFTPRLDSNNPPPPHQTCQVSGNHVKLVNTSSTPLFLKKNQHIGDIVSQHPTPPPSTPSLPLPTSPPPPSPHSLPVSSSYLEQVQIDPDNILSPSWREHFHKLLHEFSDIINPNPGLYNGYYGDVDCSLNFIKDPPASIKARLPSYSHDKLVTMANIMDDMERMGVLCKPEDLGIVPKNVHTSYLVPKTDGSYRFVTDFTNLLPFIGKLEVVAPSISQAKRILSAFKFHAELDLSNCFWQGGISAHDSQYLCTPHPFGGLRTYCREPQGIRNASEHNSERLARIFGDLERDKKMCRMADGLYVGGDSLSELSRNLSTVLHRSRLAGLTFKPSKVVICPQSTVLFGWKKCGNLWSPTNHVISPLSQAPLPTTVKQLRGFIGAYRQLSDTIRGTATTLGSLEKYVGGKPSREHVKWDDQLKLDFDLAKQSLLNIQSISIPKPSDTLHIYPDFSETANAVGSHLVIHRTEDSPAFLNGGYFSTRLEDCQTRWTPCEKECLGIKLSIEHFKPFIQESNNRTIIHTDNLICVQAWNRLKQGLISTSSKVASFLSSLSENNIEIVHFPGSSTKVADFSSRNPLPCKEKRCQICSYAFELTQVGDMCNIMKVTVADLESGEYKLPLSEKPTWLKLQKEDDTHRRLHKLITSGGLQPEPKLRGHSDLKRLYNLYRKGLLHIDPSGLIIVKHIDTQSGIEYNAISVPKHIFPGLLQSLHIKLNHPSRAQLHKFANRHFFCIGIVHTVDSIHSSCEICASLSTLPKPPISQSTSPNPVFGQNFSADVIVSDHQKILICREKLSQFTTTVTLDDETVDSLRNAIISSVIEIMPPTGAVIRMDPAPALQSLAKLNADPLLSKFNITLEIGRVHNPNKNPIAENAIKEFRKERLRLDKHGGPISELDRAIITRNMNQRIRNRGLAAKEIFHRRNLSDNSPIDILDSTLSEQQLSNRRESHQATNSKPTQSRIPNFEIGDRVYINQDLSKLKGRDEHIIVGFENTPDQQWVILRKTEKGLRNKTYKLKPTELVHTSSCFNHVSDPAPEQDTPETTHGFSSQDIPKVNPHLTETIDSLSKLIPKPRGRPPKPLYPDYIKDIPWDEDDDEPFHGFPTQSNLIRRYPYKKPVHKQDIPLHGWNQQQWQLMLEEDDLADLTFRVRPSPCNNISTCTKSEPIADTSLQSVLSWENQVCEHSELDISEELLLLSINSSDLSLLDPNWDTQLSIFRKTVAVKRIQRFWRLHRKTPKKKFKFKSSTDANFLIHSPVLSSSESENNDDAFFSPVERIPPAPSSPDFEVEQNKVYNLSAALETLQHPVPTNLHRVQDVSSALSLVPNPPIRPRRHTVGHNYKVLNSKGLHPQ